MLTRPSFWSELMGFCSLIFIWSAIHLQIFRADNLQLASLTWILNSCPESELSFHQNPESLTGPVKRYFLVTKGSGCAPPCCRTVFFWCRGECFQHDRIMRRGQPACSVLYLCYFHSQPWGQSCAGLMTVFAVSHGLKFTDPDTRPTILHNTFRATFFLKKN